MASRNCSDRNTRKTRLQDSTEKRKAEEDFQQQAELKRQKEMFAPSEVTGVRDIVVNYDHLKIKTEEDLGCSSAVKLEPTEVESYSADGFQDNIINSSLPEVKLEFGESLVVKVEETLDLEESFFVEQFSERIAASFEMALPFLFTELQLNDILACRSVCQDWKTSVDTFLDTHPSLLAFDKETQLQELRLFERRRIQKWRESPIKKLANAYKFFDYQAFTNFISGRTGKIVGSTVWLDDIVLDETFDVDTLERFLIKFGVHIKYLKIRHCIETRNFKVKDLMDRVKLCLEHVPNLLSFTLVFCIGIMEKPDGHALDDGMYGIYEKGMMRKINRQGNFFPELKNLETLVIDAENMERMNNLGPFLSIFYKCLTLCYSKQLKKFSLLASYLQNKMALDMCNVKELTIPFWFLLHKELGCKKVEKCTVTFSCDYEVQHTDTLEIQTQFPNLMCFGLKFRDSDQVYQDFLWEPFIPNMSTILILELENFGKVTFSLLLRFPNARYIKLINNHTNEIEDFNTNNDDTVVNTTKLWKGRSLYELKLFWEQFPNVSVVTLEFSSHHFTKTGSKFFIWTTEGYKQYWNKKEILNTKVQRNFTKPRR